MLERVKISWEYKHPHRSSTLPTNLPRHNASQPSCILCLDQRRQLSSQGEKVLYQITQLKLSIQCGFEMWYHSKWACGQAILRSSSTVTPSYPNCILVLIQELCSKNIGKLELQVSKKKPWEYFNKFHIPGTCKGLVSEHKAVMIL
ncbi:AKL18 protein [Puccinia sorghi]|uniref:AKL18 protein n=1 Tax=Puccinia sorghi TaxID=27349 RepID=A0A0L6UMI1_9BASI|nr:AKL18 protein [Puccinia sorghi]